MHSSFGTLFNRFTFILIPLALTACANMEPGMRLDAMGKAPAGTVVPTPPITLITAALVHEARAKAPAPAQNIQALLATPKPYVIGKGDQLSILVWDHPELNIAAAGAQALTSAGAQSPAAYLVDQSGMVQFPYAGVVKLAGLTELQAREVLSDKLVKSIKRPDITLRVLSFRSQKIYIDGEVKTAGNLAIDDVPMTVLESITRAGGFLPTADQSRIVVTRAGVPYSINLRELTRQGIDPASLMLANGDMVRVHSRDENKVYVLGEVNDTKALPMNNGKLSLAEALGEAGGLNQLSGSAKQIYVIRNAGTAEPSVFNLDASSPVAFALADNFELNPRDVVFVSAAGLARFSRILGLILPTAAGAATTASQIK